MQPQHTSRTLGRHRYTATQRLPSFAKDHLSWLCSLRYPGGLAREAWGKAYFCTSKNSSSLVSGKRLRLVMPWL